MTSTIGTLAFRSNFVESGPFQVARRSCLPSSGLTKFGFGLKKDQTPVSLSFRQTADPHENATRSLVIIWFRILPPQTPGPLTIMAQFSQSGFPFLGLLGTRLGSQVLLLLW